MFRSKSSYRFSSPPRSSNSVHDPFKPTENTMTSFSNQVLSPRNQAMLQGKRMKSADPCSYKVSRFPSSPNPAINIKISQIEHTYRTTHAFSPANSFNPLMPTKCTRYEQCANSNTQNTVQDMDSTFKGFNLGLSNDIGRHISSYNYKNMEPKKQTADIMYSCPSDDGIKKPRVVIHYMPHRTFETPILCTCVPALINAKKDTTGVAHLTPSKTKQALPRTSTPSKTKTKRKLPKTSTPGKTHRIPLHSLTTASSKTDIRRINKKMTAHSITDLSSFRSTQTNFLESLRNAHEMSDALDAHGKNKNKSSLKKKVLKPFHKLRQKFSVKSESEAGSDPPYFRNSDSFADFEFGFV